LKTENKFKNKIVYISKKIMKKKKGKEEKQKNILTWAGQAGKATRARCFAPATGGS
jgi:hypothetical protein